MRILYQRDSLDTCLKYPIILLAAFEHFKQDIFNCLHTTDSRVRWVLQLFKESLMVFRTHPKTRSRMPVRISIKKYIYIYFLLPTGGIGKRIIQPIFFRPVLHYVTARCV